MNDDLAAIKKELRDLRAELRNKLDRWELRLWSVLHLTLAAAILATVLVRL